MALDWLLSPVAKNEFEDKYWGQAALKIVREDAKYYQSLNVERDLDEILFLSSRTASAIEILSEESRPLSVRNHLDADAILSSGKSLRINGIQKFSRTLAVFGSELEQYFNFPININLYISPPSVVKALKRHYDTHDVIVLQISGQKNWHLYEPQGLLPLEHLPMLQHETSADMKSNRLREKRNDVGDGALTDDFNLNPGDLLYLPRGFPHEAHTAGDGVSCHLTVGVSPITYTDLFAVALGGAAGSDIRLRRPLPIGFGSRQDAFEKMRESFDTILGDLQHLLDVRQGSSELSGLFHRNRKAPLESQLLNPVQPSDLYALSLDTRVHLRRGAVLGLDYGNKPPQLIFGAKKFDMDDSFVSACQYAISQRSFCPRMLPDALTDLEKVEFVRQLIDKGILYLSRTKEGSGGGAE